MPVEEKKANGMVGGTVPEPAAPTFQMPRDLAKSAPRFGMAQLVFESDLDRAAYMLRDASKKSKGEDRLIAALEASGHDIAAIRRLGGEVKKRIQDGIQEATGSRRAPQQSMKIEIPASEQELNSIEGAEVIAGMETATTARLAETVGTSRAAEIHQLLEEEILDEVTRITGDIGERLYVEGEKKIRKASRGWNTDKPAIINAQYNYIDDAITLYDVFHRPHSELLSSAYHESFHRFQYNLMTEKEMKVFDSTWGRFRTQLHAGKVKIHPIEMQAVGFQEYVRRRQQGMEPGSGAIRESVEEAMYDVYASKGESPTKLEEAIFNGMELAIKVFERMWRVLDRVNNFIRGRGFQNVDDIYENLYQGQVAKTRAFDSALEAITDDQLVRMDFLEKWQGKPGAALNSVDEAIADINRQIETEQAMAMAGGC